MHVSCDFGFHKLVIVPPSRPNDSSSWLPISGLTPLHQTTLLKSDQHKESSFLTSLGRGSYSLSPFRTGMGMVMGCSSYFFISHASWLLPIVFEPLCKSLLRKQYQNSWFLVEWKAGVSWSSLKMINQLLLSRWKRWHAAVLLFFSKTGHGVGSISSRYVTHTLTASVSDLVGPTGWLSSTI